MDLTVREGYGIKFCMKSMTEICLDDFCDLENGTIIVFFLTNLI
jgi:hypothetical protein